MNPDRTHPKLWLPPIPKSEMFRLIGTRLALHTAYAAIQGEVIAKSGVGVRTVLKTESPGYFWVVIAIYAALSIALFTAF